MPGPDNSVGQLQRVHPPAIRRRHQAHRRYSGGIGHNRLQMCIRDRDVTIKLDPRLGGNENAQKYFRDYKKKQTAHTMLQKLLVEGEAEIRCV